MADLNVRGWQRSFRGAVSEEVINSLDAARRQAFWAEHLPSPPPFFTWVAVEDDGVIGFLHLGPNRDRDLDAGEIPEVYAIYVDPDHTGRGIGTRLMDRALDYLRAGEFHSATLWTLRDVPATRGFYESVGWRPDGADKTDCWQTTHAVSQVRYRIELDTQLAQLCQTSRMPTPLTQAERDEFAEAHPRWKLDGESISRTFAFADFAEAIAFVNRVAIAAETADHHPDIDIRWNRVTLVLSTHSTGAFTELDWDLAEQIDGFFL